ncbi:MAG: S46 family peptidase [Prolixibacteraceae bacterium]|nr:S46 family peptidase [Prolixibacteraceae bacterium]
MINLKRIGLIFLSVLILSVGTLRADEGMWMLSLIQKLNSKEMSKMGFKLSASDIYDINKSSLKDAVLIFGGGCTAEIISKDGLVLTNHHCGYSTIQKLSSVDHNYLQDGFWAKNHEEELPSKGLTVTFLDHFEDVTAEVTKALAAATDPKAKDEALRTISDQLATKAVGENKFLRGRVIPFYGENQYYLVVSKTYTDIRFVGAPPSSIGKFGYDTDNWMWPRHTGDFSMFRIYADKNNNPAEYSKDNVPYQPKKFLTISLKGIKQNDPAMILGYPGRTNRFMTSFEVKETSEINNVITAYVRGVRQDILMKDMVADPKIRLQYSSKFAGSSNSWKKAIAMNEAFKKLKVYERRQAEEKTFTEWIAADPTRKANYGEALSDVQSAIEARAKLQYTLRYYQEALGSIELTSAALRFAPRPEGESREGRGGRPNFQSNPADFYKDYNVATDKKVAKAMITLFKNKVPAADLPEFYKTIDSQFQGNIDAYVDAMFSKSVFTSEEKLKAAQAGDKSVLENDAALVTGKNITDAMMKYTKEIEQYRTLYAKGQKQYIAGMLEMNNGKAMYPDANFTMRMTYGKVQNYSPKDGVIYDYITTLEGVMQKEDPNNWEFVVPEKLKELYASKDFGQYALKDGRMPVAFLTTNDITGGNSGSPVMNGKGELIGTAFDGNWESMSGDIIFEPSLQRCINVDIRYTLFIMDKFGGAGYLLNEMKISK